MYGTDSFRNVLRGDELLSVVRASQPGLPEAETFLHSTPRCPQALQRSKIKTGAAHSVRSPLTLSGASAHPQVDTSAWPGSPRALASEPRLQLAVHRPLVTGSRHRAGCVSRDCSPLCVSRVERVLCLTQRFFFGGSGLRK